MVNNHLRKQIERSAVGNACVNGVLDKRGETSTFNENHSRRKKDGKTLSNLPSGVQQTETEKGLQIERSASVIRDNHADNNSPKKEFDLSKERVVAVFNVWYDEVNVREDDLK